MCENSIAGGLLHSNAYFWVVEFQKIGQPHRHLLLDASRIEHGVLVELWSRFRPSWATPLAEPITAENYQGQAPGFGSVWFSRSTTVYRAAYYATKYLTKYPHDGYPDWVLDRAGRMPRYGRSHRFFPRVSGHDAMCFCEECRGDVEPPPRDRPVKQRQPDEAASLPAKPRVVTSIRQRLERCGQSCTIVEVRQVALPDGTLIDGRAKFGGKLNLSFQQACDFLGVDPDGRWELELDGLAVTALEAYAAEREAAEEAR